MYTCTYKIIHCIIIVSSTLPFRIKKKGALKISGYYIVANEPSYKISKPVLSSHVQSSFSESLRNTYLHKNKQRKKIYIYKPAVPRKPSILTPLVRSLQCYYYVCVKRAWPDLQKKKKKTCLYGRKKYKCTHHTLD